MNILPVFNKYKYVHILLIGTNFVLLHNCHERHTLICIQICTQIHMYMYQKIQRVQCVHGKPVINGFTVISMKALVLGHLGGYLHINRAILIQLSLFLHC